MNKDNLHITHYLHKKSQSSWGGPELMSPNRDPWIWARGRWGWIVEGRVPDFRAKHVGRSSSFEKTKSIHSGEFTFDQIFQHRFKTELFLILSLPPAPPSPRSCLSGKPTAYKHSVPGSRGQEHPVRHVDLPPGLMTSRSICQELFKAENRSPGALHINKYLVDWFLPCFSKGSLLPGLSLQ